MNKDTLTEALPPFINLPAPKTKYKDPTKADLEARYKLSVNKHDNHYLRKIP